MGASDGGRAKALAASLRPAQWVKNLVLFAALLFARRVHDLRADARVLAAFVLWCAVASGVYLFNDLRDRERDRQHPTKRFRPIPSGRLPAPLAASCAAALLLGGLALSAVLDLDFAAVMAAYVVLSLAYTLTLRDVVILDILVVASGFVLRAVGGGVVIHVEISQWILLCTFLLALLLSLGKRRQELLLLEQAAHGHRAILADYSLPLLDQMMAVVSAGAVMSYALFTILTTEKHAHLEVTVPFVLYGIFRYLYLVYGRGEGGAPSDLFLTDRPLLLATALWAAVSVAVLYLWP